LDQAVELAKQEALQEGMAQGRAAALSENLEQALAEAKVQWANEAQAEQAQAIEVAVNQALAEQSQQWQQQSGERDGRLIELMAGIDQALQQALAQTQVWGDAIKRLAIHIAEQLVLAELSASPAAIQRLIDRCVAELDLPHAGLVTVELAPQDHDLIKAQPDLSWNGMELVINHQLLPGSVKVSCKDTRVSDLILHRLEPMARQLLVAVDDWKQQSAFRPGQSASRPSFQPAKAASPMPSAIAPLSVSSRLIDSIDSGGEHG
jgi:flagellar biosynthesis/type III secretory pathway protein FliH